MSKNKPIKISLPIFIFTAIALCLVTFMTTYVLVTDRADPPPQDTNDVQYNEDLQKVIDKLAVIDGKYRESYIGKLDYDKILDYVIYGYAAGTGDRYSAYMNEETYSSYTEAAVGNMVGIGIHVIYDTVNGYIEIVNIIENSPASESELQIGDLIYLVEDKSVTEVGYDVAVDLMLGEEGTNANFSVYRKNSDGETESIPFSITRKKIITQDVFSHVYEGDKTIGIIRIDSFNGKAAEQFLSAVESFTKEGVDKLIVDVRNNPGGDLNVICNVLDFLLPSGPIIRVMNRDGTEEGAIYSGEEYFEIPIAVLTNGNTASAAELFSAALKDYADKGLLKNVTLVGTTTFGKGSMQSILNLGDGTGLKLSTAMYAPPFSDNYDGVGITPDVVVELDESLSGVSIYKIKDEDDNQLMAAVKALNE